MNGYEIFVSQLNDVCVEFPHLKIKTDEEKQYLRGTIDIKNSDNDIVSSYLIEIRCSENYPYRFPILYEVGGDIPCEADFHKYPDNSCCITAFMDEFFKCKNGISVLHFVKDEAIPYLANQYYRKETGKYKNEYSHGNKGQIEGFYDYAFGEKRNNLGRNDKCFCGSNKKYKKCCQIIIDNIQRVGKERMLQFINSI